MPEGNVVVVIVKAPATLSVSSALLKPFGVELSDTPTFSVTEPLETGVPESRPVVEIEMPSLLPGANSQKYGSVPPSAPSCLLYGTPTAAFHWLRW